MERKAFKGGTEPRELGCGLLRGEPPLSVCSAVGINAILMIFKRYLKGLTRNLLSSFLFSVSEIFRVVLGVTWIEYDLIRFKTRNPQGSMGG